MTGNGKIIKKSQINIVLVSLGEIREQPPLEPESTAEFESLVASASGMSHPKPVHVP
jgi:hypothetical protein